MIALAISRFGYGVSQPFLKAEELSSNNPPYSLTNLIFLITNCQISGQSISKLTSLVSLPVVGSISSSGCNNRIKSKCPTTVGFNCVITLYCNSK